jgi:hypothetical protein
MQTQTQMVDPDRLQRFLVNFQATALQAITERYNFHPPQSLSAEQRLSITNSLAQYSDQVPVNMIWRSLQTASVLQPGYSNTEYEKQILLILNLMHGEPPELFTVEQVLEVAACQLAHLGSGGFGCVYRMRPAAGNSAVLVNERGGGSRRE